MIRLKYTFYLLSCGALFWGCSDNELPDDNTGNIIITQPLTITVGDAGFHSNDDIQTRANENGYQTEFTAGDKIGLFAVEDNDLVDNIQNLCLTAVNDGHGGLSWEVENDIILPDNFLYFAYYPYLSDVSYFDLYPDESEVEGFFEDFIDYWEPSVDQSTYDKYTAQDLMIAKSFITDNKLSFVMEHQMSLLIIDLPISDNAIETSDVHFFGFHPFRTCDGKYRYIPYIPPSMEVVLVGSYTNADNVSVRWRIDSYIEGAGRYFLYTIDGGSANQIEPKP